MPVFKNGKQLWVPDSERIRQEESERNANKVTCDAPAKFTAINCPDCDDRVFVHCPECNQKVTGCGCTLKKRIATVKEEMTERLFS